MEDFSEDSDVNPEEMARMVQELDQLDNTLLGVTPKNTFPLAKGNTEEKKKISFKDPIDDDPLADLSSDDGEDPYGLKKPNPTNAKSNRLADLFGIKNSEPVEKSSEPLRAQSAVYAPRANVPKETPASVEDNSLQISTNKKGWNATQAAARSTVQNMREQPKENEQVGEKLDDPPRLSSSRDRKSTLMEDIFGTRERSVSSREISSRPGLSKLGLENPPSSALAEPSKLDKPVKSSSGYTLEPSTTREPRRGRRNSPVISDPLGLFAAPSKQQEPALHIAPKAEDVQPEKRLPQDDLPEWLGGATKPKENKSEIVKQTGALVNDEKSEDRRSANGSKANFPGPQEPETLAPTSPLPQSSQEIFHPETSMLIGNQFDQQAALISMQQQEHELRTAATLSHQNEQVSRIVESQRAKLDEQEKMFNLLIKRQIDRQSMLETQMRIQQARIDRYIQTLVSQPTSLPTAAATLRETLAEDNGNEEKVENSESLVKKLQLETDYLESTLERMKEKHEKEIEMLQESYEKQILFLRQTIEKLETRVQRDRESLESEYKTKMDKLREEKEQLEQSHRQVIEKMKNNERLYAEEIAARHSHNMQLLEKEHAETIDGISRAKELERVAVESITTHKTDLGDLLETSKLVIENCQHLQNKLEDRDKEFGETRENYLRKQEEHLQVLRDQLSLQQEAVTEERKRLAEISQRLDTATVNFTTELAKKSLANNESEERLATRERAIIRERQLFDEQIKWERQHLQTIEETWMKEQERQLKLLSEERQAVASERTKLLVFNRLQSGSDDAAKAELEAAVKSAREAANASNLEKRKWQERSDALETQSRALREKERYLVERAKQLENLTRSALARRDEGSRALNQAQCMEQQYKQHLGQLQRQLESLAERENKVATEKLALARERLATRYVLAEKPEKDTEEVTETTHYWNDRSFVSNSVASTHFKDVVDPQLLLLKLNLDNKLDSSNELLTTVNVINR